MLDMKISNPSFSMDVKNLTMEIEHANIIYKDVPVYEGEYVIEPDKNDQLLKTKDKRMVDDVSVLAVPRHDVSNIDGTTVIIGGVPYYGK